MTLIVALLPAGATAEMRRSAALLPPVAAACISSSFGPRVLPKQPKAGTYHYGIDLPAAAGAAVFATAPGTVIRIQNNGPGGLEMLVQHNGFIGVYSHFGMISPVFAAGKRTVAAGETLGVVGMTGVSSGPHLYFAMIQGGQPVDPARFLDVPFCNGAVPAPMQAAERKKAGEGIQIGGRKYYQIFFPGEPQQFNQWRPYLWQRN